MYKTKIEVLDLEERQKVVDRLILSKELKYVKKEAMDLIQDYLDNDTRCVVEYRGLPDGQIEVTVTSLDYIISITSNFDGMEVEHYVNQRVLSWVL